MNRFVGFLSLVAFLSVSMIAPVSFAAEEKKQEKKGGKAVIFAEEKKEEKKGGK